ncbi:MAG: tripartite tricarboxylate transporter TctB family protein [Synergistaceae bacterium]|jgi:putative tricarboxylic transport membrane protein|nr:tripartite tricarboxylate transporter TctB family protein [Synergistaceae bacterium]
MRAKTKTSYILIATLAAFGVFVLFLMRNWKTAPYSSGYGPGFYPTVLVIVLFLLLLILFIQETFMDRKSAKSNAAATEGTDAGKPEFTLFWAKYPAIMFGMMIVYSILLEKLGFIIVTFVFLVSGMFLFRGKPVMNIVLSVFFTAILYFVFGKLLLVRLPVSTFFGG